MFHVSDVKPLSGAKPLSRKPSTALWLAGALLAAASWTPDVRAAEAADGEVEEPTVIPVGDVSVVTNEVVSSRPLIVEGELRVAVPSTATVDVSRLDGRGTVVAAEGTLEVKQEADFVNPVPLTTLQKAAVWLDASKTESVQLVAGMEAAGNVHQWLDVRETALDARDVSGAYAYPHWMADTNFNHSAAAIEAGEAHWFPTWHAAAADAPAFIDFGGYRSGQTLSAFAANGNRTAVGGVTWIFVVYGTEDYKWGFLFNTPTASYVPQDYGHAKFSVSAYFPFLSSSSDSSKRLMTGRFAIDRVRIDPFTEKMTNGVHLLSAPVGATDFNVQGFFNDRSIASEANGFRQGGGRLCEVVLFTCSLTAAECAAVETYLYRKWREPRNRIPQFMVAPGGQMVATVDDGKTLAGMGPAAGIVVKRGAGRLCGEDVTGTQPRVDTCVNLEAGSLALAVPASLVDAAAGVYRASTGVVARTAGTLAGTLVKEGEDELAIRSLSADVEKLDIRGGTVRLTRGAHSAGSLPSSLSGQIEDPSFEAFADKNIDPASSSGCRLSTSVPIHGWLDTGKYANQPFVMKRHPEGLGYYSLAGVPYPDGEHALVLHLNAGAKTTVTLPAAGVWRLSFSAMRRTSYVGGEFRVSVDGIDIAQIQTRNAMDDIRRYSFDLPYLSAGAHTLVFQGDAGNAESTRNADDPRNFTGNLVCMLDDIRVDWLSAEDPGGVVANGGFELHPFLYKEATGKNVLDGWTISDADEDGNCVLLVGRDSSPVSVLDVTVLVREIPEGGRMLVVCGTPTLTGEATFTRPGDYFLTMDFGGVYRAGAAAPTLRVRVGDTLLTTNVTAEVRGWTKRCRLGPFSVTEAQCGAPLAVAISGTTAGAAALLDNLRLEAADSGCVTDTFTPSGWTVTEIDATPGIHDSVGKVVWLTADSSWQGWSGVAYDNPDCVGIRNRATISRQVSLQAGTHRLSVASLGRWFYAEGADANDLLKYSDNRFAVWLAAADGATTNQIGEFAVDRVERWRTHAFLFDVPSAGTWQIGFSGLRTSDKSYDGVNYCSHGGALDGLVIEPVQADAAPALSPKLEIAVADGAFLALDTAATSKVARVTYAGRSYAGILSAATCPAFISGTGALEVTPQGSLILFR
ncbi:MAG: hypothetical protein ACI4Q3_04750 [Kiritimatiellia bacterium]